MKNLIQMQLGRANAEVRDGLPSDLSLCMQRVCAISSSSYYSSSDHYGYVEKLDRGLIVLLIPCELVVDWPVISSE
jgi:hypothetical protein